MVDREKFEAWIMQSSRRSGTHINKDAAGKYLDNRVAAKWSAWQEAIASQAQQPTELSDKCKVAASCLTYNDTEKEAVAKHLLLEASQELRRAQAQQPSEDQRAKLVANMLKYLGTTKTQAKAIVDGVFDGEHTINESDLQSQEQQSQWIDVEERLPEENCHVLVACEGGNVATTFYAIDHSFFDHAHGHKLSRKKHGKYSKHFELARQYGYRITHWMPLPLPPAPEGE